MIEFDSLSLAKTVFYKLDNYRRAEYLFVQSAFSAYMGYNPLRAVVNIGVGMFSIITLAVVMLSYFNSLSYDAKNTKKRCGQFLAIFYNFYRTKYLDVSLRFIKFYSL